MNLRTVATKLSIGGLYVGAGGLTLILTKILLTYSVSYFNLGGLGALFGD